MVIMNQPRKPNGYILSSSKALVLTQITDGEITILSIYVYDVFVVVEQST